MVSEYTWLDALFELAWQKPQGSSLIATRKAWTDYRSVHLKGDGLFPRIPDILLAPAAASSIVHEYGYPLCFYSKIDDLARASVSMIDVLLELPDQPEALSPCTNAESDRRHIASAVVPEISVTRDQVFISYSHKDKKFLGELVTHLKPFARNGSVTHWSDQQIAAGSKWFDEIQAALAKAKVAVLLVTKDFLASDFIHDHELGPLLKQAAAGGVSIRWVLVGACSYQETQLTHDQAVVSPPSKPLAQMKKADRDAAWVQICQEIKKAANQ